MKVELSREEKLINRLFYAESAKGGLARDKEAFAAIRETIAEATAALRAELDVARADADRAEGDLPAELRSLRAELETAETLRKSANAEIERLAAELETARAEALTQARIARDWSIAASMEPQRIAEARAVAIEEAAQLFERRLVESKKVPGALPLGSSEFRALAPLDPALCVVARETRDAAVAVLQAVARRSHRVALHSSGCDIHPRELPSPRFYDPNNEPVYGPPGRCSCGWGSEAADLNTVLKALEEGR